MTVEKPLGAATMTPAMYTAVRYHGWLYSRFRRWVTGAVLEIGAGHGLYTRWLSADASRVVATDADEVSVQALRAANTLPNVSFRSLDLGSRPDFQALTTTFDTIVCLNVLEHVREDADAVRNLAGTLASGGHLVLVTPAFEWLWCKLDSEAGHERRYTRDRLTKVVEEGGLEVAHSEYFDALGMPGWFVVGTLFRPSRLDNGRVNASIALFDRLLVPLAAGLDRLLFRTIGLSVMVVARRKL